MAGAVTRRFTLLGGAAATLGACVRAPAPEPAPYPEVQALIESYVARGRIAGAAVAIGRGAAAPIFLNAGARGIVHPEPAAPDTLWRIYSMTKPITAVAAMALIEDGALGLDQPVAEILPDFATQQVAESFAPLVTRAPVRAMTIRHLITHTAGLSYHITGDGPLQRLYRRAGLMPMGAQMLLEPSDGAPPADLETFGARLAQTPLAADPGARWDYSVSLDLLGLAIQRVAGAPFEDVLQRRIFAPLGMTDTAFFAPAEKRDRLSANYQVTPEGLREIDDPYSSPWVDARVMPSGGAGLISTAQDYSRFCAALLNGGGAILKPETAAACVRDLLPDTVAPLDGDMAGQRFGAGMSVSAAATPDGAPAGVASWGGAAGTTMWIDPANALYVVGMTQFMPSDAYPFWQELRAAFYRDHAARG